MTLLLGIILLASCTKTETIEVEKIVNVKGDTITVTETVNIVTPPDEYSFTRDGASTVFYTGQTDRLKMATELKSAMNNLASTELNTLDMFNNGNGFEEASLNASTKTVGSKIGKSGSATVKPLFVGWITEFTTTVISAVNSGVTAEAGVAGLYTEKDASREVKVNAKGFELNQVFSKGVIGALQIDQIINGYLSFSKLNSVKQANDDGDKAYKLAGQVTNTITKMEHYWDEGFGYLQGLDDQLKSGLKEGGDGAHLNYYLNKINSQDGEKQITSRIYEAFRRGRAAIVAKNYQERDLQAVIIGVELSKVIGYKAGYYLRGAAKNIEKGEVERADALHALSEAYGFILGLQYTKAADGEPYLTNAEVNAQLSILSAGTGGFWERTSAELTTMADLIDEKTGLNSK